MGSSFAIDVSSADAEFTTNAINAIYVGTGGTIKYISEADTGGTILTLLNVPNGSLIPIKMAVIKSTDTTASGIIGIR